MRKEKKMKDKKMFYTSDGVKIIGYSNAKEFNKALEEWTKKNQDLVEEYPQAIKEMEMTEKEFDEKS